MAGPVLVVGASLGGLRAAEQLRAAGWRGPVSVVGDEPHMPYNRPPLSKEALVGAAPFASLAFTPRSHAADVRWLLGHRVAAVRLRDGVAVLDDGAELGFAALVAATGLRPRRLRCPGPAGPASGRHVLRTLTDARALRAELLRPGVRLVVVGAGFIGCEVASAAVRSGVREVVVVDPEPLPMLRPLGELLARALLRLHRAHGVRFRLGEGVAAFEGDGRVTGVVLDGGQVLAADVVVECVGAVPNTEWLAHNGLDLSDGVLTDGQLRMGGLPDAYAVGDVARFPDLRHGGLPRRVEHWSMPGDSARHAGRALAARLAGTDAGLAPFAPLPSFWSDQHGIRIQAFGAPELGTGDVRVLDGDIDGDVVAGYHAGGRLVGVVALGGPGTAAAAARHRARLLRLPLSPSPEEHCP
ncbi:NAD(P)/FAD-dependent oxidoreductase [Streptomyces silvensis]|uniref:Ferredoxin reductase n=1 Tax=Streptomyces silvensis TaxID=1765722 RepID=A0A0W7X1R6_9ACTN|nr:FAD-dependent oxidoreductase [Streptomyces silvensis]KUF16774.1 ferredoxin reductase [Streptomyces silvensis]